MVRDWKTTLTAIVGMIAYILTSLKVVDVPVEVQTGIVAITVFVIGLLARDNKTETPAPEQNKNLRR